MQADFNRPILAIDTSTSYLSLALRHRDQAHVYHKAVGTKQSELILPQIGALFAKAGIGAADLGAIVYAQGPGAFTGLRIGTGVAQGLAAPFTTPLIGIPCLDAVAYQRPNQACVLAATDARMGEVFYAWFDTVNHRRLSDYQVGKAAEITAPDGMTCSDGIGNAFALADKPPFDGETDMPTAADYLNLAATGRYPATDAAEAELLYVRNKIALTAKEQAERKGQA
ncbi:tRNA (adenosine(37)-N6)-threonylcarbamoyltransferase complex dimerization subunit type 1 TsaB [Neisseria weixii]|uniref:tRNA (Adenosine(37)-N6)-threonylcarbamoyltransferase complex dimerization subunit type 1 TsaB n=1 Tax=Neisseria weixii TaxID=1853276 RepID=A0A3N4MNN3_9NEIS|nr:tRNA (adenosine(37)-N6)-threonylcarbamoyltransferase complex dimerization subunit type 1 TsaB [Neisseria weixii]ATD65857.1 tRNA (adenosine(37)-N6)-threonylcarbamoyltransferase complex dimerization subunit type 1 TsaB [Neisseria weixii]RPD83286.1 tRNA (adenosine(37)-N6)-threonylcarbamoyltransferase complex dimerization subunit type 1 TsaB [Neisseria weixii]RPD83589.1 tRNA (adenosine(37)-N6)-threonylcarbamoyltransferase complex dimerization subunit type 1 TsaB [Neisseria weixii]